MPTYCGIIRGKRERANKIVLCVKCLLSDYVKGWLDINEVLFSGLKEDWLSKIEGLRQPGKSPVLKKWSGGVVNMP